MAAALLTDPKMLQVGGLNQHCGGSHILPNLTFEANLGEVTLELGCNGLGKTPRLKSLMGVMPIKTGSITLAGANIAQATPSARMCWGGGHVTQGHDICLPLTVEDNLRLGLAVKPDGTPIPPEVFVRVPALKQGLNRCGGDWSGGQQQQLAIARALAAGPQLLILEEPTAGSQPSFIKDIGRVIRGLSDPGMNGQRMALILVEQNCDFGAELADLYLVMERGEIIARVIARGRGANMEADGVRQRVSIGGDVEPGLDLTA